MSYILQGRALPAVVAPPVASITIQDLDAALTQLVALAPPEFPYSKFDHVEKRFQRTSRPRQDFKRAMEASMLLKLQEYDREAAVREIDRQWLSLRRQRNQLLLVSKRKTM